MMSSLAREQDLHRIALARYQAIDAEACARYRADCASAPANRRRAARRYAIATRLPWRRFTRLMISGGSSRGRPSRRPRKPTPASSDGAEYSVRVADTILRRLAGESDDTQVANRDEVISSWDRTEAAWKKWREELVTEGDAQAVRVADHVLRLARATKRRMGAAFDD